MMRYQVTLTALALALCGCVAGTADPDIPLPHTARRPTPLSFGLYVTPDPAQNPIDPPERFTGYHAATDFEMLAGEKNVDVPVRSVCSGYIRFSGFAEGYGGLVSQECALAGEPVTVLYGHLAVASLIPEGSDVQTGALLGILGAARSGNTDGSRKHLHLGIIKGHVSDVRGYVQEESELEAFIDPQSILNLHK